MKPVLHVWDLSAFVYAYWCTMKGRAAHGFCTLLGRVIDEHEPTAVCIAADTPFPNWRHELAPDIYKANRGQKDGMLMERLRWAEELAADIHSVPTYSKIGWEADDVVATVTTQAVELGYNVRIIGKDKDLMQLVSDSVIMWEPKGSAIGIAQVVEKFGVQPGQVGDYLALCGDTADNIPGVAGIGPKAAVEILKEYGSLDAALRAALDVKATGYFRSHTRFRSILRDQAENVRLCQKLVALDRAAPIGFNIEDAKR